MSKTVSIRLEDNVIVDLDKLSRATERSKAWLMEKAVEQYIENESWQVESIKKALQKVKSGKAKFTNHESVTQWLESWGTDNELDPPNANNLGTRCHCRFNRITSIHSTI